MEQNPYPISTNLKKQCLSKCYPPKTIITHPITIQQISHNEYPFCAVDPFYDKNIKAIINVDTCALNEELAETDDVINMSAMTNLVVPLLTFDTKKFLTDYYNINSQDDFNGWLVNNKNAPIFTQIRIIDCFLRIYGKKITLFDDDFINSILDIIKKFWIKKIYNRLHKHISILNNECIIVPTDKNKLKKFDDVELRKKYIETKIITKDNLYVISNKYVDKYTNKLTNDILSVDTYLIFLINALEKITVDMIKK